jgi:2-dehydro-3-deoxyphosphogalactonate aldolase
MFDSTLAINGLIAILRGLRPDEAEAVGSALYAASNALFPDRFRP